jgi:hypothetical protein
MYPAKTRGGVDLPRFAIMGSPEAMRVVRRNPSLALPIANTLVAVCETGDMCLPDVRESIKNSLRLTDEASLVQAYGSNCTLERILSNGGILSDNPETTLLATPCVSSTAEFKAPDDDNATADRSIYAKCTSREEVAAILRKRSSLTGEQFDSNVRRIWNRTCVKHQGTDIVHIPLCELYPKGVSRSIYERTRNKAPYYVRKSAKKSTSSEDTFNEEALIDDSDLEDMNVNNDKNEKVCDVRIDDAYFGNSSDDDDSDQNEVDVCADAGDE